MSPLRDCRMVLCVGGAGAAELHALGVPTVTLPARSPRDCRRLHHFRHRFDGIVCDLAALGGAALPELLPAFDETLLPGGVLLVRGGGDDVAGLASTPDGAVWRKPPTNVPGMPPAATRTGPYADLLTGCRRVAELGAGRGRFLDALRLRGVATVGVEPDADLAAAARAHGHAVATAGLDGLRAAAADGLDGVFAAGWLDALTDGQVGTVLAACHHVLPAHGRLVVRTRRDAAARLHARFDAGHWTAARIGRVPLDPDDAFVVALAHGAPAAWPADAATVPIDTRALPLQQPPRSFFDLERSERQVTSQGGEDGVLAELFARLGTTNRHYVEFGCGDGLQCNTTQLRRAGWRGLLMDGVAAPAAPDAEIHAHWITAENIEALLDAHGVPAEPDLLSIDVDGNDWWIWRAIERRPRVVVVEYNANLPADRALTIPYDPAHRWDGSDFYGASLLALWHLGRTKGYTLVYCTQAGVNAFFVRDDLLPPGTAAVAPQLLYRPPNYWYRGMRSRPDLARAMLSVSAPPLPAAVG